MTFLPKQKGKKGWVGSTRMPPKDPTPHHCCSSPTGPAMWSGYPRELLWLPVPPPLLPTALLECASCLRLSALGWGRC